MNTKVYKGLVLGLMVFVFGAVRGQQIITTVAGGAVHNGEGGLAVNTQMNPNAIAIDGNGNVFFIDDYDKSIRKINVATTVITTIAGTGTNGYSGDNGAAINAQFNNPDGIALDNRGNIFISDRSNQLIRKIDLNTGVITTVAGVMGFLQYNGDNILATKAHIDVDGLTVDSNGNIYVADGYNKRIRKIESSTGLISTIAGTGIAGFSGDGGLAINAQLNIDGGSIIAIDVSGNIYFVDNYRVRKINVTSGIITTVSGTGTFGSTGDNGLAIDAQINGSLSIDKLGNLLILEQGRIRKIDMSTGVIQTIVGTGSSGFSGDSGLAINCRLTDPISVAFDAQNNLYFADNFRLRRVNNATGIINTFAGIGVHGFSGDNDLATKAQMRSPSMAVDDLGNLYITDTYNQRIRFVDKKTGIISTIAGTGVSGYSGDNGPAANAQLNSPSSIVLDGLGNIYFAEYNRIRMINKITKIITTVAGIEISGYSGDKGLAINAKISPLGLTFDKLGNLYFSQRYSHVVRKIDQSTGIITTIAGIGTPGFSGDNALAVNAQLNSPVGLTVDNSGNIFIADRANSCIRKIEFNSGIITTIVGKGGIGGFSGDNDLATKATLLYPTDVAFDDRGNLYIVDQYNYRIRKVNAGSNIITTIAGNESQFFGGDNGLSINASLAYPYHIAIDGLGNLYLAGNEGFGDNRIRKITCLNQPAKPIITINTTNPVSIVLTSSNSTGNQWYLNGSLVANATAATFTITDVKAAGSYTVKVTVDNCASEVSLPQVVTITGDIKSPDEETALFPNPVKDKLTLRLNSFEKGGAVEVQVYDLTGKTLEKISAVGGTDVTIEVSRYATGKYLLRATQGKQVQERKFVKE